MSQTYKELDEMAMKFGSDKSPLHHDYTKYYDCYFSKIRSDVKNMLEIGVFNGSSIKMWQAYFPNAIINGIDIDVRCKKFEGNRIKIHHGDQSDIEFLKSALKDQRFDIIIDDGSHMSGHQIKTFEFLFDYVVNGGIYVIEDTKTSYHKSWVGPNESCIEFFKNRIDDVEMHGKKFGRTICSDRKKLLELSKQGSIALSDYEKKIESIHFYSGLIFVLKQE